MITINETDALPQALYNSFVAMAKNYIDGIANTLSKNTNIKIEGVEYKVTTFSFQGSKINFTYKNELYSIVFGHNGGQLNVYKNNTLITKFQKISVFNKYFV